jgi:ligand-binding sensor domain-containing protein
MKRFFVPFLTMGLATAFLAFGFTLTEAGPLKRPLTFQQFTSKDGLSSEMVNAIAVQGEEVWFGTYAGGATLYHKSKKTWKPYTTKGELLAKADDGQSINWKNLLPYNHVSVILPDTDRIWFGTYFYGFGGGGISYYQPQKTPPWKRFNTNNGVAKKVVSMAVDADWLWVGSEKGLSVLDKKTEQWRGFSSTDQGLSGNFVNALLNHSEFLWAGTNGGISRLHKSRKAWKTYSEKEGIPGEIKSLVKVGQKMWAGAVDGALFEYDPTADLWKKIEGTDSLKSGGIQSILATRDRVYVCRDNGVSTYDLSSGQWESITAADGLPSDTVIAAAEDQDGIWFGTDKGVSRLILEP